jgi:hypothetical protein
MRKYSLRYLLVFIGAITFVLISCNRNQKNIKENSLLDIKSKIKEINDNLAIYEEPSQTFKIIGGKPTKVIGKFGTIISINPKDLVREDGKSLNNNIELELKEMINQEQLLRTNAQTLSNGQLLVSGGAYYINLTSNGHQLKLKDGKNLSVEFPKITNDEMTLFFGKRDSLGQINWQQSEKNIKLKPKRKVKFVSKEEKLPMTINGVVFGYVKPTKQQRKEIDEQMKNLENEKLVYEAIQINKLGWINCDRFATIKNKTKMTCIFNPKDRIEIAKLYLVFKEINSVMSSNYFLIDNNEHPPCFDNIPVGENVKLIAFYFKKGKTYSFNSDFTIAMTDTVNINFKESNSDETSNVFHLNN